MTPEIDRLIDEAMSDGPLDEFKLAKLIEHTKPQGVNPAALRLYAAARARARQDGSQSARKASKCPSCNSPISGLARVCGECGFVMEDGGAGGAPDLHASIKSLEDLVAELKAIPLPGSTAHAEQSRAGASAAARASGLLAVLPPDERFDRCVAQIDRERRSISTYFGNDPQVKRLLGEIEVEVRACSTAREQAVAKRKQGGRIAALVGLVVVLGGAAVALRLTVFDRPSSPDEYCRRWYGHDDFTKHSEAVAYCTQLCDGGAAWACSRIGKTPPAATAAPTATATAASSVAPEPSASASAATTADASASSTAPAASHGDEQADGLHEDRPAANSVQAHEVKAPARAHGGKEPHDVRVREA